MKQRLKKWLVLIMISAFALQGNGQMAVAYAQDSSYWEEIDGTTYPDDRTIRYDDGDYYIGEYAQDTGYKNGAGEYHCSNGTVITGVWKNNILLGTAKIVYKNKEKYYGKMAYDRRNGTGTYWFKNRDKYKGKWRGDRMCGKGTYTWKNKNYVKGVWKGGKLNGRAELRIGKYIYSIKASKGKLINVYNRRRK